MHIRAATQFMDEMNWRGGDKREAHAFRAGKEADFSMNATLREFREHFAGRFDMLQLFLKSKFRWPSVMAT